jgi:hypothetical protein
MATHAASVHSLGVASVIESAWLYMQLRHNATYQAVLGHRRQRLPSASIVQEHLILRTGSCNDPDSISRCGGGCLWRVQGDC